MYNDSGTNYAYKAWKNRFFSGLVKKYRSLCWATTNSMFFVPNKTFGMFYRSRIWVNEESKKGN